MRNAQCGVYPFRCKVYGTCINSVYGLSGDERKDKLFIFVCSAYVGVDEDVKLFFPFCTLCLSCNVCISHIPKHAQLPRRYGLDNMGPKRA